MKMLAIYNGKNKRFRRDGDEFEREARGWWKAQPATDDILLVDVRDGRIRREIRKMKDGLDVLAVFDHGTPKGLPRMRESYKCVKGLAETIASVTSDVTILLYSCSCGRGWWWWKPKNRRSIWTRPDSYSPRDGYAVALGCELAKLGVEADIFAHLTAGHTTRNPHVVRIYQEFDIAKERYTGRVKRTPPPSSDRSTWQKWKADMRGEKRFTFWR